MAEAQTRGYMYIHSGNHTIAANGAAPLNGSPDQGRQPAAGWQGALACNAQA